MTVRECAGIMGMPVTVHIVDPAASTLDLQAVWSYLRHIDCAFSTYKPDSETERLNRGELLEEDCSKAMREVLAICERTRVASRGFFDARYHGRLDPSGVVKGYAIHRSAELLRKRGLTGFFVDAGGDAQTCGGNERGTKWRVGIRDPFDPSKLVNVVHLSGEGIATSGNYERGEHIYDPVRGRPAASIASVTVVAPDVCEADRFATAAFAMGEESILFLEELPDVEGFMVRLDGSMFCTTGFPRFMQK